MTCRAAITKPQSVVPSLDADLKDREQIVESILSGLQLHVAVPRVRVACEAVPLSAVSLYQVCQTRLSYFKAGVRPSALDLMCA